MKALWIDDKIESMGRGVQELTHSGIDVVSASTIEEAYNQIECTPHFDLVIADLHLPILPDGKVIAQGHLFAGELRKMNPLTPILGVSAYRPENGAETAFDAFFSKEDLFSEKSDLVDIFHETVAKKISSKENIEFDFVKKFIEDRDFELISESQKNIILPGGREFQRCVEMSSGINDYVLKSLASDPDVLMKIDDQRFEEICATVLSREGYHVHVTSKSRDGGYDILAFNQTGHMTSFFLVECKRWDPNRKKVGVPILRQLNGVVESMNASGGVLMTTSSFSKPAMDYVEEPTVRMDLVDLIKLRHWMEGVSKR